MLRLLELRPDTGGRLTVDHDGAGGHLVLVASDGSGRVAIALELEPHEVGQLVSVTSLWLGVQRATVQPLNSRPGRRDGAEVAGEASTRVDRTEDRAPRAAS